MTRTTEAEKSILTVEISELAQSWRAPLSVIFGLMYLAALLLITCELAFGHLDRMTWGKFVAVLASAPLLVPRLPALYFSTVLDTLAGTPCLILSEQGFVDTRLSEEMIRWEAVGAIEEWRPWTTLRGLRLTLTGPCAFTPAYLQRFGRSRLLARYARPDIIHVSLWTLRHDKQALIDVFKYRQQQARRA